MSRATGVTLAALLAVPSACADGDEVGLGTGLGTPMSGPMMDDGKESSPDDGFDDGGFDGGFDDANDPDDGRPDDGPDGEDSADGSEGDTGSVCPRGELGCACDNGHCVDDLECRDDRCKEPEGAGGSSGGPGCSPDDNESNDTEQSATALGQITDCDRSGAMVSGTLDDSSDVDWYRFSGSDEFLCVVDPTRVLSSDGGLRLCKFVECTGAATDLLCPLGTSPETSPEGRVGCCSSAGFSLPTLDCPSEDDDATVYLRIDQAAGDCVDYSVAYHY